MQSSITVPTNQQEDQSMRTSAFVAMMLTAVVTFAPRSATAAYNLPWCAQYYDSNITSCAFTSYQQCMATISGIGGLCIQNFRYASHPPYAEPWRAKPRRDSSYH
jgi:hypothetical protein